MSAQNISLNFIDYLIDATDALRGTKITLPVRSTEVVVSFTLAQVHNCIVQPIDGAPGLGKPGNFTQPRRYMVINESRRPDGKEAKKRLYEVRVTFLP